MANVTSDTLGLDCDQSLSLKEPTVELLQQILNIHDKDRHGTCINEPENNYGTKSSTIAILEMGARSWDYWHRERKNDQHICQEPFQPQISLSGLKL